MSYYKISANYFKDVNAILDALDYYANNLTSLRKARAKRNLKGICAVIVFNTNGIYKDSDLEDLGVEEIKSDSNAENATATATATTGSDNNDVFIDDNAKVAAKA
ncbi:hypothetical protein B0A49_12673 [Cryomyces minteri]|uniref:Uncharacterized protein n=1 Tax=Cryomyces minteri TaxID=331657 RepID=A0A4U0WT77_9PEZI|nr:hypothetical protein B0A49_12673 [Cryomyces minteri]